jgi:mRNA interferase RelE/StbE
VERGSPIGGPETPFEILFERRAEREYGRLSGEILRRVSDAIDSLATEPRPHGATKLAGRSDYRIRVGDWRVVYEIDDPRQRIVVVRVAHRSDVYRRL